MGLFLLRLKLMKIGNIQFHNNLILAPMAGVTDIGFRSVCIDEGADCAVTEMVSAKALIYHNPKTFELLETADNEKIKILQLFGFEPNVFAEAVRLPEVQKFDIIDINMGCPMPKIVNNFSGAALMKNLPLARDIIRACVSATTKPITVKFRAGWDENSINAVEFAKMCEEAGAAAITIHARTREQFYSGQSDWELIRRVKSSVNIPVIASGDVLDKASYDKLIATTHCDAVMIGRGALGKPTIFDEVRGVDVPLNTYIKIDKQVNILRKYYSDDTIVKHMRKHFLWYLKNYRNAKAIKAEIVTIPTLSESLAVMKNFLDTAARTDIVQQ